MMFDPFNRKERAEVMKRILSIEGELQPVRAVNCSDHVKLENFNRLKNIEDRLKKIESDLVIMDSLIKNCKKNQVKKGKVK